MRRAGLSVDVDSVASHLEGYGFQRPADDGAAYRLAVPRMLELLDRHDARATFFLVADEAREHPEAVRQIVDRGHEVASHSLTHRLPFGGRSGERLDEEVRESRALLRELSGTPVHGFRAPGWDVAPDTLSAVARAGYSYDASVFPSRILPWLVRAVSRRAARDAAQGRSRRRRASLASRLDGSRPTVLDVNGTALVEIPVCTAPVIPVPYYHTLRFLVPALGFSLLRATVHRRRGPITYQFHAVDVLGTDGDELDPRIRRHPGMDVPLERKLSLADDELGRLAGSREIVPLRRLAGIPDPGDGAPIPELRIRGAAKPLSRAPRED